MSMSECCQCWDGLSVCARCGKPAQRVLTAVYVWCAMAAACAATAVCLSDDAIQPEPAWYAAPGDVTGVTGAGLLGERRARSMRAIWGMP